MPSPLDSLCWFALRTRSRHEKKVRERLVGLGIQDLLPLVTRVSHWKDRKKKVTFPLFPGYCFARFLWKDRGVILTTPGVVAIVGSGSQPESIPDCEIDALQRLMDGPLAFDPHPFLHEGMTVEVTRGPLQGVHGMLVRKAGECRLVIAVHLIQQAAAVEIDADDVIPVPSAA